MTTAIHLGYEVGTGRPVEIPLGHMAVTGQTQLSGKTTTLEALISRSGVRAVAFVTKRGESSFENARQIRPYFHERADWQFVESILESAMRQKLKFERAWIVRAAKGAKSLADVRRNVRQMQNDSKRSMDRDIFMLLGEYLDLVVPLLEKLPASKTVDLEPGLNVMALGAYPTELQALVIQSVLAWIYRHEEDVVAIIPEAWEFVPQKRGAPVKLAATELIRKGAGLGNHIWLDSQDIAGVEKEIVRQASVWLLGVQREANEIKRTLNHIPAGVKRPKAEDVARLGRGQFFACWGEAAIKTYVQPAWLGEQDAIRCARGEIVVSSVWKKHPRRPAHQSPLDPIEEEEPPMSKAVEEKLDQLITLMTAGAVVAPTPPAAVPNGQIDEEALYQRFKARLAKEAPALLKVLSLKTELQVTVERQVIEIDGKTVRGRLAKLVADGWFDQMKSGHAAYVELERTGGAGAKPNVYKALDYLSEIGIVTKETNGYQVVPGAKINIVGAGRR